MPLTTRLACTLLTSTPAVVNCLPLCRAIDEASHSELRNAQKAHWPVDRKANGIRMVDFELFREQNVDDPRTFFLVNVLKPYKLGINTYLQVYQVTSTLRHVQLSCLIFHRATFESFWLLKKAQHNCATSNKVSLSRHITEHQSTTA